MRAWLRKHPTLYRIAKGTRDTFRGGRSPPSHGSRYVSYDAAVAMVEEWSKTLSSDCDAIVGIPRAGLFIGAMLAEKWGKPLTTPDSFVAGTLWQTSVPEVPQVTVDDVRHVLLVDDTVYYGDAMAAARAKLLSFKPDLQIRAASLFVSTRAQGDGVEYFDLRTPPHLLEWNLVSSFWGYEMPSVDMDGVLCEECPPEIEDGGAEYSKWLIRAKPHLIPTTGVDLIITARFERFRPATEEWLKAHNVKYRGLVMLEDAKTHSLEDIVDHKASALGKSKGKWFWESTTAEAVEIRHKTGLPVLAIDRMRLYA